MLPVDYAMKNEMAQAMRQHHLGPNLNQISGGSGIGCYAQYTESVSVFNTQHSSNR